MGLSDTLVTRKLGFGVWLLHPDSYFIPEIRYPLGLSRKQTLHTNWITRGQFSNRFPLAGPKRKPEGERNC